MTTQGNFKEYHGIAMCKNHGTLPLPIFCLFCILFSRFRNRLRSAGRGQQGKGRHSNQPIGTSPVSVPIFQTLCVMLKPEVELTLSVILMDRVIKILSSFITRHIIFNFNYNNIFNCFYFCSYFNF